MTAGRRGRCEKAPPQSTRPLTRFAGAPLSGELFEILSWVPFPSVCGKLSREGSSREAGEGLK